MPFKRGDQWVGKVVWNGEQVWCGTHKTRKLAKAAEDEEKRVRGGGVRNPDETCDEFAKRWLEDFPFTQSGKKRRDSTVRHYRERVGKFAKDFEGVRLVDVDRPKARRWALDNPRRARAVAAMFTDAYNDGLVTANVWLRLGIPRLNEDEVEILTLDEFERAADLCEKAHGPEFRSMFEFSGWVGCRPGELCGLRWDDIGDVTVRVERQRTPQGSLTVPKNGRARTVVLPPQAADALGRVGKRDGTYVFRQIPSDKPLIQAAISRMWAPVRVALGRPDLSWYPATKHFCGSQLANRGVMPIDIALQLGHTDKGETALRHYVKTYEKDAHARLLAAFKQNVRLVAVSEPAENVETKVAES